MRNCTQIDPTRDKSGIRFRCRHSILKSNDHIGSVDFPYVLTMNESICKTIKFSDVIYNERYEVFPQVFQNLIKMEYTSKRSGCNKHPNNRYFRPIEILQYKLNLQKDI